MFTHDKNIAHTQPRQGRVPKNAGLDLLDLRCGQSWVMLALHPGRSYASYRNVVLSCFPLLKMWWTGDRVAPSSTIFRSRSERFPRAVTFTWIALRLLFQSLGSLTPRI